MQDIRNFFKRSGRNSSLDDPDHLPSTSVDNDNTQLEIENAAIAVQPTSTLASASVLTLMDLGAKDDGPVQPILDNYPLTKYNKQNRSFSSKYFENSPWLEYSIKQNAVFCFPCRNFSKGKGNLIGHESDLFISKGFSNWKKIKEKLDKHGSCRNHLENMEKWTNFQETKKSGADAVSFQLSTTHRDHIMKNRKYIKSIANIALLLARQGLAYRGDQEDETSLNKGNFKEMCAFLSKYDAEFEIMNKNPKNYTSPKIQNEIIEIISMNIEEKIVSEIKQCGMFSIMCDEARSAKKEQLSFCVRYANDLEIKERFLTFIDCSNARDASSISEIIINLLKKYNIEDLRLVGQSYDGAAVMSGKRAGVQSKIREKYPIAIYTHCMAHRLNLAIVDACNDIQSVRTFFNTLESLYVYFSNPSIHQQLKDLQKVLNIKPRELNQLSDTRWSCRARSCSAVKSLYDALYKCLSRESLECNDSNAVTATGILSNIRQPSFIISLHILDEILNILQVLSSNLQEKEATLGKAATLVNTVVDLLKKKTER